jgi:excisionase family DNA binding protein
MRTTHTFVPSPRDIEAAKTVLNQVEGLQAKDLPLHLTLAKETNLLPRGITEFVIEVLSHIAHGRAINLKTLGSHLSSKDVANYLGVARQFLVREAEAGQLPSHKLAGDHRFKLQDVLAYEQRLEKASLEARQALADEAQRLGLYD